MMTKLRSAVVAAALVVASGTASADVNVYSARQEGLIKPQFDAFTKATGIRVNLVTGGGDELLQRLKAEGRNSPADLLFTADAGNLFTAKEAGLFQKVSSPVLEAAIPARLRDDEGFWFGLGMRARPLFYVEGKVDPQLLSTYEGLADPALKGRILVRSSTHVYNQSLLASLIARIGPEKAEAWAKGVAANLARKPQGGDRDQIKAAAAGQGDVVISNTYYYVGMLASSNAEDRAIASKLKVAWPNQGAGPGGVHINVSGAGLTASARNKDEAVKLLEFLVSDEAQRIYADAGYEYPVKPGVPPSPMLAALGEFKIDDLPLSELGRHQAEAVRIFDRVGWR